METISKAPFVVKDGVRAVAELRRLNSQTDTNSH